MLIHTQLSANKDKNGTNFFGIRGGSRRSKNHTPKTIAEIVIPKDKYDHAKFKKCISVICDRVLKGLRVAKEVPLPPTK